MRLKQDRISFGTIEYKLKYAGVLIACNEIEIRITSFPGFINCWVNTI